MPIVVLVGPTAAGKTGLSVQLAESLGGEVVNADSMQLYQGMDIGTAKVTASEKRGVPHHVFDIWEVSETADVARYQAAARRAVDDIRARGKRPIVVGGSGLYVQAVTDEMNFPGTDPAIRRRLESELAHEGPGVMWRRLQEKDKAAAEAILPSNGRRIVRALEVIEITGRFQARLPEPVAHYDAIRIGIDMDTPALDERVERRVERMWQRGLIDETRTLEAAGLRDGRTASRALGYQQVLRYLAGEWSETEAFERTVSGTRRFVRRQRSWFKRDRRLHWLDAADPDLLARAEAEIERAS
ncbi:tRNA (adenosine(37)-N6)-dimethylallyltransferase MiaA [Haloglycomyces albus]|uniref:tRNA (adenosine(37)-N6)-dimethylallyltransferase MiaA n=1 Tax=Haloglycomyces albus TaxID=526067 RepID=UPI00046D2626|nr:tRNA (adenosine(37)-N6)-dimethylallyltransferase MiaA [Haloglycomyces albus]